jgi:hypothetical protein
MQNAEDPDTAILSRKIHFIRDSDPGKKSVAAKIGIKKWTP